MRERKEIENKEGSKEAEEGGCLDSILRSILRKESLTGLKAGSVR